MTSRTRGDAKDLWGREFLSTAVTEHGRIRPLVPGTRLRLAFEDGDVRAYAGCNHLTGRALVDGRRLAVERFASTDMACDPVRQEQDAWLASFLAAGPTWRLDGDDLVLGGGGTEIRLTDRSVAEPDRPLRGTRWVVDAVIGNQAATILETVDCATTLITTPMHTIQLHSMALANAAAQPAPPCAA